MVRRGPKHVGGAQETGRLSIEVCDLQRVQDSGNEQVQDEVRGEEVEEKKVRPGTPR